MQKKERPTPTQCFNAYGIALFSSGPSLRFRKAWQVFFKNCFEDLVSVRYLHNLMSGLGTVFV